MSSNAVEFVFENKIIKIRNPDPNETILNYKIFEILIYAQSKHESRAKLFYRTLKSLLINFLLSKELSVSVGIVLRNSSFICVKKSLIVWSGSE